MKDIVGGAGIVIDNTDTTKLQSKYRIKRCTDYPHTRWILIGMDYMVLVKLHLRDATATALGNLHATF